MSAYAVRLAGLMTERAVTGLARGYTERASQSDTVRGRIDLPRQIRDRGIIVGPFHLIADEFTTDVVWNQVPLSAAVRLASIPGLDPTARTALDRALALFPGVTRRSFTAGELDAIRLEAQTEPYRPLIDLCRALLAGHGGTFLLNLGHLFQAHITNLLLTPPRPARTALPDEPVRLTDRYGSRTPLTLVPDITVAGPERRPVAVWDVKWKHLGPGGPEPADLHQVLGYASALGVSFAGLIYPGRRFSARVYESAAGVRVAVITHRVTGSTAQHAASSKRVTRVVLRPDRFFGP